MLRAAFGATILLAASSLTWAQATDSPTFEVASIKPAAPQEMGRIMVGMNGGPGSRDPEHVTFTNVNLRNMLTQAYNVKQYQISGPSTLDTERFDMQAKVAKGATKEEFQVMLQNLIKERFKMEIHKETKELPIYALVVGKNGPKLTESTEDAPPPATADGGPSAGSFGGGGGGGVGGPPKMTFDKQGAPKLPAGGRGMMMMVVNGRMRMQANKQPIGSLCDMLANQLGRPVIDQTGLTKKYDYALDFAPDAGMGMKMAAMAGAMPKGPDGAGGGDHGGPEGGSDAQGPTLVTAVQEQLGLKLEAKKGPVDTYVVDRIEKTPTEN